MKIGIVGAGYVGLIWGTFLASKGQTVQIIDASESKISDFKTGLYANHFYEKDFNVWQSKGQSNVSYSTEYNSLEDCEVIFVCVGTPNSDDGELDTANVEDALKKINDLNFHQKTEVLIRSTMPVGKTEKILNKFNNINISFGLNPEFLREGNAFDDLLNEENIVLASFNRSLTKTVQLYKFVYQNSDKKIKECDIKTAELIKSVNNSWHALKVTFANEIGRISELANCNVNDLMDIFKSDTKLNISNSYLTPGLPFGGSCLVKDTQGLASQFSSKFFQNIIDTNNIHIQNIINENKIYTSIGIIGLTFKKNTNDTRFSVGVEVAQSLIKLGKVVKCYDEIIDPSTIGLPKSSLNEVLDCEKVLRLN